MTVPAWISSLTDPSLKKDFTAFASKGTLTEAEMTTALTDLVAELTSAKATLSKSQLTDLQSIAANIASMGASAYLQYIFDAFVDGNAANANWTGGGATPTALGNLAVGYTATQLGELEGKWFLGTDLPVASVVVGSQTTAISYTSSTAPLYGASGPQISDVNQGHIEDCYVMAALAEVAAQNPSLIQSMITDNGNGTFGVRFYVSGVAEYVTVDRQLVTTGIVNTGANIWASVVETAYAELQAAGNITGGSVNDGNSFSTIGNAGAPEYGLEEVTGATSITDFLGSGSWTKYVFNQTFTTSTTTSGLTSASVLSTLAADLLVGDDIDLASNTNATDASGKTTLVAGHTLSVYGYDAATGLLEVRNPWGVASGQTWDTTFEIGMATLLADGDGFAADNVGAKTSVAGASTVAASALQAMAQVKSFAVADSVADVDAALAALIADSKLSGLTVTGTTAGETLTLTGLAVATTINMEGDADAASVTGFKSTGTGVGSASALNLGSAAYDKITLGSGSETILYTLGASSGVEDVTNFSAAHDLLSVTLGSASLEQTLVQGGDWLSASADLAHGVFLAGVTTTQSVKVSGGVATVA